MTGAALGLVVLSAFAHATWNLAAKRAGAGGAPFVWLYMVATVVVFAPVVLVRLVTGPAPGWQWPAAVAVSGSFHTAYFLTLQRGYATGDLSVVYPLVRGTGPLLSVALAVALLGERPHPLALAGAVAVVAGVLAVSGGLGRRSTDPATVGFGLLTGCFIAGYTLWDAHAVTALAVSPLLLTWGDTVWSGLLLTPTAVHRWPEVRALWRAHRRAALTVAVLSPAAYLLVLSAFRLAPVSYVAPARELSIVVGAAYGLLLLGEPQGRRRLVGAIVVVLGVAVLSLA